MKKQLAAIFIASTVCNFSLTAEKPKESNAKILKDCGIAWALRAANTWATPLLAKTIHAPIEIAYYRDIADIAAWSYITYRLSQLKTSNDEITTLEQTTKKNAAILKNSAVAWASIRANNEAAYILKRSLKWDSPLRELLDWYQTLFGLAAWSTIAHNLSKLDVANTETR